MCINGKVFALSTSDNVRYCSENCITEDYKIHQYEQIVLEEFSNRTMQHEAATQCHLIFRLSSIKKVEEQVKENVSKNFTIPELGRLF